MKILYEGKLFLTEKCYKVFCLLKQSSRTLETRTGQCPDISNIFKKPVLFEILNCKWNREHSVIVHQYTYWTHLSRTILRLHSDKTDIKIWLWALHSNTMLLWKRKYHTHTHTQIQDVLESGDTWSHWRALILLCGFWQRHIVGNKEISCYDVSCGGLGGHTVCACCHQHMHREECRRVLWNQRPWVCAC